MTYRFWLSTSEIPQSVKQKARQTPFDEKYAIQHSVITPRHSSKRKVTCCATIDYQSRNCLDVKFVIVGFDVKWYGRDVTKLA